MIVEKLKSETTWISIFDLYFKYRSPLPASHDDFYEFKVEAEVGWLGNVTLNHRKIPKVFLQGNEKNIFMWRGSSDFKWQESLYKQIWENFYKENHF